MKNIELRRAGAQDVDLLVDLESRILRDFSASLEIPSP